MKKKLFKTKKFTLF